MNYKKAAKKADESATKRKPGRQPMTPEEREAAAKARAEEKAKAENMKPDLIIQYQTDEVDVASLVDAAKADFHQTKKRTLVTALKLYIKPEERTAYYVINNTYTGSVTYEP